MSIHPGLFAVCILAAPFAALTFFIKRARYRHWVRTSGTVIELVKRETNHGDNHSITFSPRISFQTAAGEMSDFVSSVSSVPAPSVGETMEVLYNPSNPREAIINGFLSRHLGELVILGLSLVGILIYLYQQFVSS